MLRGICDVELVGLGLILERVRVLKNVNGAWCALPRTVRVSPDNNVLLDEYGNRRFLPLGRWANRPLELQFSREVIADLLRLHPAALEPPPPPPTPAEPQAADAEGAA